MKTKLASFISAIGHPLLTLSLFAIISLFTYLEFKTALLDATLIVLGIFFPLTLKMYLSAKKGIYTNFDVSDKTQRQSWYIFVMIILALVSLILFVTDQARTLRLVVLFSLLLITISKLINYLVKSSLHVSLNVFLSLLILPISCVGALLCFLFALLIAWAG